MIAPDIEIVDVEPDGFGVVCSIASTYDRPTAGELHVLHDGGRVLRVVHTVAGPTAQHREPLGADLAADAASLRLRTGVDRVVLVDRARLVAEAEAFAAVGPASVDQGTVMRRSNDVFWSSPAVVTDPAPPSSAASWDRLADHVRSLGPDFRALVAGYDGDACAFTLLARVVDGLVVHLTSLPLGPGQSRPPVGQADELVTAAEQKGPVAFALVADLAVLRTITTAPDLPAALAACASQALITRGLPT